MKTLLRLSIIAIVALVSASPLAAQEAEKKPWLGVSLEEGGEDAEGLKIVSVVEGSPAEAAGLKAGDMIVKIGGKEIRWIDQVRDVLSGCKPGDELALDVLRENGKEEKITVKLAVLDSLKVAEFEVKRLQEEVDELEERLEAKRDELRRKQQELQDERRKVEEEAAKRKKLKVKLGAKMRNLTPNERESHGRDGLLVTAVSDDSPAKRGGLKADDLIISADGNALVGTGELRTILLEKSPGDTLKLKVVRDGKELELEIKLGEA